MNNLFCPWINNWSKGILIIYVTRVLDNLFFNLIAIISEIVVQVFFQENGKMFKNTSLFDKSSDKPEYFMRVSDNKILVKGGSYYKPYKYELIRIN